MNEKYFLNHIHNISRKTGFQAVGDDGCVFEDRIYSTDQFIENTHFTWQQMSPQQVGYKATIQALSDLAAMASPATAVLCSAAWPASANNSILEVFNGIEKACLEYRVPLIGGDISSAPLTYLNFTVVGKNTNPPGKNGAKAGDLIALTGPVGSAQGGFYSSKAKLSFPRLQQAFESPKAHIQTACELNRTGTVTALTDVSDSLAKSLYCLTASAKLGAQLLWENIPVEDELRTLCKKQNLSLSDFVFYGGEDYQLLMTLAPNTSEKLISDHCLNVIGKIISAPEVTYIDGQQTHTIAEVGWDPF